MEPVEAVNNKFRLETLIHGIAEGLEQGVLVEALALPVDTETVMDETEADCDVEVDSEVDCGVEIG